MWAVANKRLWYEAHMSAKAVQISLADDLLKRIDRDPEVRRAGRSAFVRAAIELYLQVKDRRATDQAIRHAYTGRADDLLSDAEALMEAQAWPKK
jgi:metal-responsive CopG/Arc/MetJ family transcriptional regulator